MDIDTVTSDISKFGNKELDEAGDLLKAYAANPSVLDGDEVTIFFNMESGYVFLSDEDANVALINDDTGKIEKFYTCPYCGHEGFHGDMCHSPQDPECTDFMESLDVAKNCDSGSAQLDREIAGDRGSRQWYG